MLLSFIHMCILDCPLEDKYLVLFFWIMPIGGEMTFSNLFVWLDIFLMECQKGEKYEKFNEMCVCQLKVVCLRHGERLRVMDMETFDVLFRIPYLRVI